MYRFIRAFLYFTSPDRLFYEIYCMSEMEGICPTATTGARYTREGRTASVTLKFGAVLNHMRSPNVKLGIEPGNHQDDWQIWDANP